MKSFCALVATLATLALAACSADEPSSSKPQVLTGLYPLQFVAEHVAGPDADVQNLTSPGAEPHDLELSPKQVAAVKDADALVYIDGLQPAIDDALDDVDHVRAIDLAESVTTLTAADEHDHSAIDPHLWLDPTNLQKAASELADTLAAIDPDHGGGYRSRADELIGDLQKLDDDFRAGTAQCQRRTVVTAHAAFGYLANRYGLEQIPIAGLDPSQEPSPADLADIAHVVTTEHVTTVFTERLVSPAIARTVAREAGVTTAVLDPIEGLVDATAGDDYLSLMRQNLAAIQKANDCT